MSEPENNSGWVFRFCGILILVCIIGLLVAIAIPNRIPSGHSSPAFACINNLRQIDAAINEWALEDKKPIGTPVTWNDIKPYIKLDATGNIPGCYQGGKYKLGKVGDGPQVTCSLSTLTMQPHKLP